VSGDVGAAFWPDTPEGYRELFALFRLPIDEPIAVESSYMLGGGEYRPGPGRRVVKAAIIGRIPP
jgi:hypothetical protein